MNGAMYDTLYRRIIAKAIDMTILIVILWIITLFIPKGYEYDYDTHNQSLELIRNPIGNFFDKYYDLVAGLFISSYFVLFHYFFSKTVGKLITDVQIFDVNESSKITFFQAVKRNIIDIILCILLFIINIDLVSTILLLGWFSANFIQLVTSQKKRSLEDLIAGTIVLKIEIKKLIIKHD